MKGFAELEEYKIYLYLDNPLFIFKRIANCLIFRIDFKSSIIVKLDPVVVSVIFRNWIDEYYYVDNFLEDTTLREKIMAVTGSLDDLLQIIVGGISE